MRAHRPTHHPINLFAAGAIAFLIGYAVVQFVTSSPGSVAIIDSLNPPLITDPAQSLEKEPLSAAIEPVASEKRTYLQVIDGCSTSISDACVNAYATTSTSTAVIAQLRKGMVLEVADEVVRDDRTWYEITFSEALRYPERLEQMWYVPNEHVRVFEHDGPADLATTTTASSSKLIIVDRGDQMLYAYDGEELFMKLQTSTGLELTPTPRGMFTVYRKTPSRYMQGPIPGISTQYYDLPGVPWNLYFSKEGAVVHGVYWHDKFGQKWSHGCVNLPYEKAEELYEWAELGTSVLVRD